MSTGRHWQSPHKEDSNNTATLDCKSLQALLPQSALTPQYAESEAADLDTLNVEQLTSYLSTEQQCA